jgi:hypothetical protein
MSFYVTGGLSFVMFLLQMTQKCSSSVLNYTVQTELNINLYGIVIYFIFFCSQRQNEYMKLY